MGDDSQNTVGTSGYAEAIVETVREPLVVLDEKLQVVTANRSFYKIFHVKKRKLNISSFTN